MVPACERREPDTAADNSVESTYAAGTNWSLKRTTDDGVKLFPKMRIVSEPVPANANVGEIEFRTGAPAAVIPPASKSIVPTFSRLSETVRSDGTTMAPVLFA